ncbi:MAG: FtsX-like permease family protein [Bifidobacteriaceae bacterium]|jgi:putative ABC transport system permease protein|nr:FtsX-like permease family protein [Bifidobacteriaceae bacterium]
MLVRSLTRRRSRVLIEMLAVAIGATTLTALATLAVDIPRQMGREMRSAGANLVVIADESGPGLSVEELAPIEASLSAEQVVGWAAYRYATVRINSQPYLAAGTDIAAASQVNPYWAVDGGLPVAGEALIGVDIADWIGLEVGDPITVTASRDAGQWAAEEESAGAGGEVESALPSGGDEGESGSAGADGEVGSASAGGDGEASAEVASDLRVSGILRTGGSEDAMVIMALADLEGLVGNAGQLDLVEYSVNAPGSRIEALGHAIEAAVPGANAGPVTRLTRTDADVLEMLQSLLGLIAVIVLGLTMIGVSTTMMAVVAERRNEIALRKALGAHSKSIAREFLGEAMVLGAVGGLLGACAGFGLAQAISLNVFQRSVGFVPWLAVAAVAASILVTRAASGIPVRRAAQVDPAIVLKGE